MATVRITDTLLDRVREKCNDMYRKRIAAADEFFMDKSVLAEKLLDAYLDESGVRHHFEVLPKDWVSRGKILFFSKVNGWQPELKQLTLPVERHIPRRLATHDYYSPGAEINSNSLNEVVAQWQAYEKNKAEVYGERSAFEEKIQTFLKRHTTLRSALAQMPALWEMLPQETKDRHNSVVIRSRAAKSQDDAGDDIDVNELTAQVVVAKVTES